MKEVKKVYKVKEKVKETHDVVTLKLVCDEGNPSYRVGQFITVFFPETGKAEGKAYTISSVPFEGTINITVKAIGEFSNRLTALVVGDTITASEPYGYFYTERDDSPLVMIAGGIGVVPFRSMVFESLKNTPARQIFLFCSDKTMDDIVFRGEFNVLQVSQSLKIVNHITREENVADEMINRRIKISDVLDKTKGMENPEFLICGSISFVRDFWKGLKEAGISEEMIYTEAFF